MVVITFEYEKIYSKACYPVVVFGGAMAILSFVIGGDKAMVVFQLFGLPWSVLLELDPYAANLSSFQKLIAEYYAAVVIGSIFLNALIMYGFSVWWIRRHPDN